MDIVRDHVSNPEVACQADQAVDQRRIVGTVVVLEFNPQAFRPEQIAEDAGRFERVAAVPVQERGSDRAAPAPRESDQAGCVIGESREGQLCQALRRIQLRLGDQLAQIALAHRVLDQQCQVLTTLQRDFSTKNPGSSGIAMESPGCRGCVAGEKDAQSPGIWGFLHNTSTR
jgi:hypothetical protein